MRRFAISFVLVAALAACGGSSSATESPRPAAYKDMNHKQRAQFMKEVVLPKSREIFVAFDAKFKDMDCKTCHGDGVTDGTFKMPNPKIRPLPNSEAAFGALVAKEPDLARWGKFMGEKVEPLMAQLLQEQVFDPQAKTGEFSCVACHTLVNADGTPAPLPEMGHHEHGDHDDKH